MTTPASTPEGKRARACVRVCMCMCTCVCVCMYMCVCVGVYVRACVLPIDHIYISKYRSTCKLQLVHTSTTCTCQTLLLSYTIHPSIIYHFITITSSLSTSITIIIHHCNHHHPSFIIHHHHHHLLLLQRIHISTQAMQYYFYSTYRNRQVASHCT